MFVLSHMFKSHVFSHGFRVQSFRFPVQQCPNTLVLCFFLPVESVGPSKTPKDVPDEPPLSADLPLLSYS